MQSFVDVYFPQIMLGALIALAFIAIGVVSDR
jgi:hypothetical protein